MNPTVYENILLRGAVSTVKREKYKLKQSNENLELSKQPKRHLLREKETRRLLLKLNPKLRESLIQNKIGKSKTTIELYQSDDIEILVINQKPLLARKGRSFFPTLTFTSTFSDIPEIIVDMGSISHICNGADVMAPGIVSVKGDFDVNDLVLILDERHRKPLAIGIALMDSNTLKITKHGKIVKNLHYVSDKIWKELQKI